MTMNARLLTKPRLVEIVGITDEIADLCGEIADALAEYENADDYPSSEQSEVRQEQRDAAITYIENLLSNARKLETIYERLGEDR